MQVLTQQLSTRQHDVMRYYLVVRYFLMQPLVLNAVAWFLSTAFIAWLITSRNKKHPVRSFTSRHARLFPDLHAHPGNFGVDEDSRELKRRLKWLASKFPRSTKQALLEMAEAGFRAEVRTGSAVKMTNSALSLSNVHGPHPKYYVGQLVGRQVAQPILRSDMVDAFTAYDFGLDWAAITLGMEPNFATAPYISSQKPPYKIICVQSRLFQQLRDEEVLKAMEHFVNVVKDRVFDPAIHQDALRQHCYKENITEHLNSFRRGEDVNTDLAFEIPTGPGPIDDMTLRTANLSQARSRYLEFAEEVERAAACSTPPLHPDDCDIGEIDQPTGIPPNPADLLPPLEDPVWEVPSVVGRHSTNAEHKPKLEESGGAIRRLVRLIPADVGLLLVFRFLGFEKEESERLIKHVALWKSEKGADALLKMGRVAAEVHDLIDFIAFLCEEKTSSMKDD